MDYRSLPKVELHLHLDCSLSYDVVKQLKPSVSFEEYRESFIAPPKCPDLVDYLLRAIKGFELMQSKEALRLVTMDLFQQLKDDNVVYAEIRFAPLLHLNSGLTPQEVVDAVNGAVEDGIREMGVEARLILCTLRHFSKEQSIQTARLVEEFIGSQVVGFDIAGDEAGFPIDNHIAAYQYAREKGIHCTAHAGEAKGPDSVWETLHHLQPSRIGHGIRSAEDPVLLEHLRKHNVHLEVCPTSNIQTNIFDTINDHSIDMVYRSGISLSINTDGRTLSDTTLSGEYHLLEKTFNWNKKHFLACNLEAIDHSFISPLLKEQLRQKIKSGYQ